MSKNLKEELLRLGSENPKLRPHIRPIIAQLESQKNASSEFKNVAIQDLLKDLEKTTRTRIMDASSEMFYREGLEWDEMMGMTIDPLFNQGSNTLIMLFVRNVGSLPTVEALKVIRLAVGGNWTVAEYKPDHYKCTLLFENPLKSSNARDRFEFEIEDLHSEYQNTLTQHLSSYIQEMSSAIESLGGYPNLRTLDVRPYAMEGEFAEVSFEIEIPTSVYVGKEAEMNLAFDKILGRGWRVRQLGHYKGQTLNLLAKGFIPTPHYRTEF